ncbi:MAG: type IV secretion system protein [Caulobacter sp.]|nr:type IV secretion system protein [Caulobacter sp.]
MIAACASAGAPLVQGLIGSVDCQVHGLAEAGYTALAARGSPVATLLTVLMTLYIAFVGYKMMLGRGGLRMGDLTVSVIKLGLVVALATNWALVETLVYDALFKAPTEIGGLLLGRLNGEPAADPFVGLQSAFDALQKAAEYFASRAGARDSIMQGGPGFAAFAANGGGLAMLLSTLGVVLACKVVLSLLLALTPLIAGLMLFETTQGLVEGWLKAMIALAVLPMIATLALSLELAMLTPSLKALAALRDAQQFAPLDIAPAVTILVLSLVFAGVMVLAAIAVSVAAAGLRLPRPARSTGAVDAAAGDGRQGHAASEVEPRSRAAHVAAAVAALERRDASPAVVSTGIGPRRLTLVSDRGPSGQPVAAGAAVPLGASYRRPASPRRGAANARRDL